MSIQELARLIQANLRHSISDGFNYDFALADLEFKDNYVVLHLITKNKEIFDISFRKKGMKR
jgi:hypothetical protein